MGSLREFMKALYAWHERIRSFEVLRVLLLDLTMHLGIEKTFGVASGEARSLSARFGATRIVYYNVYIANYPLC